MQPKSIILFFYGYILFFRRQIDNLIYKICAIDRKNMTWQKYSLHLIAFNALVAIFSFVIFYLQDKLF